MLTELSIELLKNFASINQGMTFKPGRLLRTMSVRKTIFANAEIDTDIVKEFSIYDLNEFLGACSLIDSPTLEHREAHMVISNTQTNCPKINYYYSAPNVIVTPPEKDVKFPSTDVSFALPQNQLTSLIKAAGMLKLKSLLIKPNEIVAMNDVKSSNQYAIPVDMTTEDEDFAYYLEIENMKLIQTDYRVDVTKKGVVRFICTDSKYPGLQYLIAQKTVG